MEVPLRLQKRFLALLQQADISLLENELWAIKAALDAYQIFHTAEINACEELLRMWEIKREDWDLLTRDEQLSAAAIGSSYLWMLQRKEYSNPAFWVEKLIWHQQGKLWWPHLVAQWVQGFQHSIETLWRPEEEQGLVALLMQLEERYEEYFTGELFNEQACNKGLQLLDEWFAHMSLKQSSDITYPVFIMAQLQIVRQHMNRIYAYLIEGKNQAQELLNEFPDPGAMPHRTAARILLSMIEQDRGDSCFVQSKEEACAFNHIAKGPLDTCDNASCKKLLSWVRSASRVSYFRHSQESRVLIDEIRAMQEFDEANL